MKIMKKDDMLSKNMMKHVLTERKILSLPNADFIVKLVRTPLHSFDSSLNFILIL